MEENKSISEEIEESLRICEELLGGDEPEKTVPETPAYPDWTEFEEPQIEKVPLREPEHKKPAEPETVPEEKDTEFPKKRGILHMIISLIICIGIAIAAAVFINKYVANHTTVDGASMEPALYDGDNLIIEKLSYLTGEPQRFDVIVFRHSADTNYIKRIVGLPGEKVRIEEGKIYINERPIYDSYGDGTMTEAGIAEKTLTLGGDEYFVLGDNRDGSEDSRDKAVGLVKKSQILGRAWLRVTPFERFGIIENEYRDK